MGFIYWNYQLVVVNDGKEFVAVERQPVHQRVVKPRKVWLSDLRQPADLPRFMITF